MNAPEFLKDVENRLKELAEETDEVKKSDFFKEYLDVVSKFWNYSYHNQLLIYFQSKNATRVAGFVKWQELGRTIKKGSKAIKILAPFIRKESDYDFKLQEEVEKDIVRFYPVNVFDVSQTHGKELPKLEIAVDGNDQEWLLDKLKSFCKDNQIKLDFKKLGVNGLYGYSLGGKVVVSNAESINTQANTLIHEIAHELIHKDKERKELSKQQKEIQAEGTAYVVTKHLGLGNKSFNYLALYDADYKKIMENLAVIANASKQIIEYLAGENPVVSS